MFLFSKDLERATGHRTEEYLKIVLKYVSPVLVGIITIIKFYDAQPIKYGDVEVIRKKIKLVMNKFFSILLGV